MGSCNVAGLPLLGSAGQQDHESLAVGTIVDAVPGTEVDSKLGHAFANPLVIAEVSKFEPVDPCLDARPNLAALALQPLIKVVRTVLCHVVDDFDQGFYCSLLATEFRNNRKSACRCLQADSGLAIHTRTCVVSDAHVFRCSGN